jgi:glycosyltransferase involved in cell wall biosynthesis
MKNPSIDSNKVGISVVIPSYNQGQKLVRAVQSCCENQDLNILEIIVVDDASQEKTESMLMQRFPELMQKSVLRLVRHKQNQGTFEARKTGISESKGKYVLFLDADDQLEANSISYLYSKLEAEQADICFFGVRSSRGHKGFLRKLPQDKTLNVLKSFILDLSTPPWGIGGKVVLTDLLKRSLSELSYVRERFLLAEDALLLFVSAAFAKKSISINRFFYIYNDNEQSITKDANRIDVRDNQLVLAIRLFKRLEATAVKKNSYFTEANQKLISILESHRAFNKRFSSGYNKSCWKAYCLSKDIRYLLMIILNILSLGRYQR